MHEWSNRNGKMFKEFVFSDFIEAFSWMTKVALWAEKIDHHPEWTNHWNRVSVTLCTHSQGNTITDKDHALARIMDQLYHAQQ
ncbi:MAG: 4a-hydroxytetrahydrobiopterin dehydratase [Bacteroidetes bacterium]|jgi:4a-hydroxytetrahydrobiopterin dehydratase|nr:4a-hydroxytetrahydrobiopterin dehydratase [Bacteroidota bacterium]